MNDELSVVQISTSDTHGGAALVAFNLHRSYMKRGLAARMIVGNKFGDDPNVVEIPRVKRDPDINWITWQSARVIRYATWMMGWQCFVQPGFWKVLDRITPSPQVLHCHNLGEGHFDLRVLPPLCQKFHVFLTLHDMWPLTGHCAHSFECDRWKTGCGDCPDLTIYPGIRRDATRHNWQSKRSIYTRSYLHVAAPARWLLDKVKESVLAPGSVEYKVIPHGVDLTVFRPGDRARARAELGFSEDAYLVLFVAAGIKRNCFKDIETLRAAVALVGQHARGRQVVALAVGEDGAPETLGRTRLYFIGPQSHASLVRYYHAVDLYLHAARADTFPNTVLEALACGVPVVASDVGGIHEQVIEGVTGRLVPAGDAHAMAAAALPYLENKDLRNATGEKGAWDARSRFSLKRQADEYIAWYRDTISAQHSAGVRATTSSDGFLQRYG
jgi:glycosyltransferase involved in cell wall biosynthesis